MKVSAKAGHNSNSQPLAKTSGNLNKTRSFTEIYWTSFGVTFIS
jgi:hypothetical protein